MESILKKASTTSIQQCTFCRKPLVDRQRKCAICLVVAYCSRKCMLDDRKAHRKQCSEYIKLKESVKKYVQQKTDDVGGSDEPPPTVEEQRFAVQMIVFKHVKTIVKAWSFTQYMIHARLSSILAKPASSFATCEVPSVIATYVVCIGRDFIPLDDPIFATATIPVKYITLAFVLYAKEPTALFCVFSDSPNGILAERPFTMVLYKENLLSGSLSPEFRSFSYLIPKSENRYSYVCDWKTGDIFTEHTDAVEVSDLVEITLPADEFAESINVKLH